uniref:(California timema) hypothetical protein n=1 Tax=Timema californicum TaxID=61474 RepID=A0A7R9J9I5_TIMCA|nr:unnamed protein product [Timema californicum]
MRVKKVSRQELINRNEEREEMESVLGGSVDLDSNIYLPVIDNLVHCKSSTLDHAATEVGDSDIEMFRTIAYTSEHSREPRGIGKVEIDDDKRVSQLRHRGGTVSDDPQNVFAFLERLLCCLQLTVVLSSAVLQDVEVCNNTHSTPMQPVVHACLNSFDHQALYAETLNTI